MAANDTRLTTTPTPGTAVPHDPSPLQLLLAQKRLASRARRQRILDLILVTLLVLLAFALALTPLRNSDFLLHLATGRLIAQGNYSFGTDPFAHTTADQVWVNHAWLFDLGVYVLYQLTGAAGIILLKAVGTVALGLLLLRISRIGKSLWWPVLMTTFALVAVAPRLLFIQPTLISFLFVPATLGILLWRGGLLPSGDASKQPASAVVPWHYWPLWALFVLWVNMDEWFFLGPVTVGLFTLGQWLQGKVGKQASSLRAGELRALLLGFAVGVAVCVINPHHVRAFALPGALGWFGIGAQEALSQDTLFRTLYYTPLQSEYYQPNYGLSVAGMAGVPLAALGLFSFLLNFRTVRFWRVLIWVAFLLLALSHARAIPFFALVAGPITALNFQDHAATRWADPTRLPIPLRRWLVAGRFLTVLLLLILIGLCWPGWMHSQPYYSKRIALVDDLDPTLAASAQALRRLREEGILGPDARGFNYSPETANYLAWYCPEEKGFFDSRYLLQAGVAGDYTDVRRGLQQTPEIQTSEEGTRARTQINWLGRLQKRKVTHVILYSPEPLQLRTPLAKFASEPDEWTLLYIDGHTAVYGLNAANPRVKAAAYRPTQEGAHPPRERWLDMKGPTAVPEQRSFWSQYTDPPGRRDPNTDEANMLLMLFESQMAATRMSQPVLEMLFGFYITEPPHEVRMRAQEWYTALAVGTVLGSAQGVVPLVPVKMLSDCQEPVRRAKAAKPQDPRFLKPSELMTRLALEEYSLTAERGTEWYPLLAVRAARRGLANNLEDANAHFALGDAYLKLFMFTRERGYQADRASDAKLLSQLRSVQIMATLNQAILLNPDFESAHRALAFIYANKQFPYLDLALKHFKAELRLSKQNGRRSGETPKSFQERITAMEKQIESLQSVVRKAEDQYELTSATFKDDQQRAQRAFSLNLAEMALTIMRKSESLDKFGSADADLMLQLLLETGQLKELAEGFGTTFEKVLGKRNYHRYRFLIAMARGNYIEADAALEEYGQVLLNSVKKLPLEGPDLKEAERAALSVVDPLALALRQSKQTLEARPYLGAVVGQLLIESNPQFGSPLWLFLDAMRAAQRRLSIELLTGILRDYAECFVVRGLLAMEVGDTARAAEHFEKALKEWNADWDAQGHRMHLYGADYLKRIQAPPK